jgi:undecaprenyl-diphosphatase
LATATLILGIGLSRIYLGVHYFTDVVAGYCAAGVWVSTLLFVARIRHRE